MKSVRFLVGLVSLTALISACGKAPVEGAKNELTATTSKYAGAVVIEGGEGDVGNPLFQDRRKERKPLWRWVICIENSVENREGEIEFDLASLNGGACEQKWESETSHGVDRLKKVHLNYSFSTSKKDGYDRFHFDSEQEQSWNDNPPVDPKKNLSRFEMGVFSPKWTESEMRPYASMGCKIGKKETYLISAVMRFGWTQGPGDEMFAFAKAECERAGVEKFFSRF